MDNSAVESLFERIPQVTDLVFNYYERPITYNYNIAPDTPWPTSPPRTQPSTHPSPQPSTQPNTRPSTAEQHNESIFPREPLGVSNSTPPHSLPIRAPPHYTFPPPQEPPNTTWLGTANEIDPPPGLNLNVTHANPDRDRLYTTQINATIDYELDMDGINNVFNITDVLTNSIANSLENIENIYPNRLSISELLNKTTNILYKDIDDADEKCHICNEIYTEFDICRRNTLCGHYFHQTCIDNWYTLNTKCPICQQVI